MNFYMVATSKVQNHHFKTTEETESEFKVPHVSLFSSLSGALKSLEKGYETVEDALRRIYEEQDILYVYQFEIADDVLESDNYFDPDVLGFSALSSNPSEYWSLSDVVLSEDACREYSIPSLIALTDIERKMVKERVQQKEEPYIYYGKPLNDRGKEAL